MGCEFKYSSSIFKPHLEIQNNVCSLASKCPRNKEPSNDWPYNKGKEWCLTGYSVSIHVIEHIPKAEDPGCSSGRTASEQRGAEFLAGLARVKVRVGFQRRTHAARQCLDHIRTAAVLNLASIALHTHLLARKIQLKRERDTPRRKTAGKLREKMPSGDEWL